MYEQCMGDFTYQPAFKRGEASQKGRASKNNEC